MTTKPRLMDLEEFLALPEEKPYLELIDGEVCQKPVGKRKHSRAQTMMLKLLLMHPATAGGEPWTELGMHYWARSVPRNHRVPDVSYFKPGRDWDGDYPDIPPDLAVEVRSKGQPLAAVEARLKFLRDNGVPATLLVDPDAGTVTATEGGRTWTAHPDDEVVLTTLDGFSFRVRELL